MYCAVYKKDDPKHFAISCGRKILTPFELTAVDKPQEDSPYFANYFAVYIDDKIGIVDMSNSIYIRPEYDSLTWDPTEEPFTFVKDGQSGVVTFDGEFISSKDMWEDPNIHDMVLDMADRLIGAIRYDD
jgi:hypothetical protein